MNGFMRYAIYYTPPPGPLAEFGAAWTGWDPRAGRRRLHPAVRGLPLPIARITEAPRKYGFHATLKPPFALKAGFDISELHIATEALAASLAPVLLDGLTLARLDGFLALVPKGDTTPIALLAARIVEALDGFRAAPTEADLARRQYDAVDPAGHLLIGPAISIPRALERAGMGLADVDIVDVDVEIPGCPPEPAQIVAALRSVTGR